MALSLSSSGKGGVFTLRGGSFGGSFRAITISTDADAQAFFSRVTTAGGTLTTTEQSAIITLVTSLKSAGIWTKMSALYPMVGASAAACAQNLKSGLFTGTFTAGWTYQSTGVTPNGTSAYMNTGFNTSASLVKTSAHVSFYTSTNSNAGSAYEIGNSTNAGLTVDNTQLQNRYSNNFAYFTVADNGGVISISSTDSRGFWCGTRVVNNQYFFKNGSQIATGIAGSGNLANNNLYIGAANAGGTAAVFSNKQCSFASIGEGLSGTNASDFYTAVQAFQTTLSRQV